MTPLRSLVRDTQDSGARTAALAAIKAISCVDGLYDKDPGVRIAATKTIGQLGWRATSAGPGLIDKLSDPETKVRVAAADALRALGPVSEAAVQPASPRSPARPTPPFGPRSWGRSTRSHRERPPCSLLT